MEILRKITVRDLAGKVDIKKLLEAPDETLVLGKIFGVVNKAKPDSSALGEFLRFYGSIRGVTVDGEIKQSGSLILPGVAQDFLYGALQLENVESVQFGFEISVKYDESAIAKYVYKVTPLIDSKPDDPMERLQKELGIVAPKALENKASKK